MVELTDNSLHDSVAPGVRTAYIGLGSNLGSNLGPPVGGSSPAETVDAAILRLGNFGTVVARSSLYRTAPVGPVSQPDFVNAVAAVETALPVVKLLHELMKIEREFGRDRSITPPKGPRSLDLDILLIGDLIVSSPELIVPHAALAERRFVLAPLAEIAPRLVHPVLHRTIAELLADLPDAGANEIGSVQPLDPMQGGV